MFKERNEGAMISGLVNSVLKLGLQNKEKCEHPEPSPNWYYSLMGLSY